MLEEVLGQEEGNAMKSKGGAKRKKQARVKENLACDVRAHEGERVGYIMIYVI